MAVNFLTQQYTAMNYRDNPKVMSLLSARLQIRDHFGMEYIYVDYRDLKERDMIQLASDHLALTMLYPLSYLADFHRTYVTPDFMTHVRPLVEAAKPLATKGAFLGIDPVKSAILKGIVLFSGVNYQAFDTEEDALLFLSEK